MSRLAKATAQASGFPPNVLACAPVSRFHYELVVGNGIGEDAVA